MKRQSLWRPVLFLVCFATALTSGADEFSQWTAAQFSAGALVYSCVAEVPANKARTTIGIGEIVELQVNGHLYDLDYNETEQIVVEDYPKGSWALFQPAGGGYADLWKYTGGSTELWTYVAPEPYSVTVTVAVTDSRTMYNDDEFWGFAADFNVILPTGVSIDMTGDDPERIGDPDPQGNQIGALSYFETTILPTTVSFTNVWFFEISTMQIVTFPNGQNLGFSTWYAYKPSAGNIQDSYLSCGLWSVYLLWNGQTFSNFDYFLIAGTYFYEGITSSYVPVQEYFYRVELQANKKSRVGYELDSGTLWGGWQGPYE